MSKITELGPITGDNTRSEDLFVIVNLVQGDDGTKNISRAELVEAIQYETFSRITITGGTITGITMTESTLSLVDIDASTFADGEITTSSFADGDIFNSTANNVVITDSVFQLGDISDSTFDTGELLNSTGDNLTVENSAFNNGTISNTAITDSTANNVVIGESSFDVGVITNSEIFDSTANNIVITNSDFSDGIVSNTEILDSTANNIIITNAEILDATANNVVITNAQILDGTANNVVIDNSLLTDFDMDLSTPFDEPVIDEDSYFALKNNKTGETEQFSYKQFYAQISKTTDKALKVYVDANGGDDANPGTVLQPVRTLPRAAEIALEKAGGVYTRNDLNNAIHISCGPGTYYIKESIWLPDDCALTATAGQYATVIEAEKGYERINAILVGSGCYVQGFGFMNFEIDNFDYPTVGFGVAYRPGALLRRSPYLRDSTQLSNFNRLDVEPPLQPFNSKGTISDLGTEFVLEPGHVGVFDLDDEVTFSSGATGFITWTSDLATEDKIYVRNLKGSVTAGDLMFVESGGTGTVAIVGPEDFPNPLVGRGGGCVLADRAVLDTDSLYTYVLCFGFTPRTQNGLGYVARNGAGINGIGSLSIFVRCAFYALDGGQMTLNNSGTQFGDISMRAKGSTDVFQPRATTAELLQDKTFADTLLTNRENIIDDVVDYITTDVGNGGLGYQAYDAEKCQRDSGIIIDSVGYDIALDSNYWGRLCGITYRSPISYVVVNEQLTETTGAINHLKANVDTLFANADAAVNTRTNTSFSEILNVLEFGEDYASPITFADTGVVARTASRELLQENKEFIAGELIDWIEDNDEFFAYDSAKCRRDTTDYILPAVRYDLMLETNYNSVTAGNAYYMATAGKVINNQKEETISAYTRLRDETNEIVVASPASQVRSDAAFNEIIDILENGVSASDPIVFSDNVAIPADKRNARTQLQNNRTYIQDHIMGYINDTYFIYDADKCQRDTAEYILPAVQRDLALGTNFNSIQTGIAYYSATASEVVNAQLIETAGSVTYLKGLVNTGVITDPTSITRTNAAFDEIIDIMNNGLIAADAIVWSDPAAADIIANGTNARQQLQANREFLQEETIAWIEDNYFAYDGEKCARDVGLIIDSVRRDVLTGSNFNAVFAGLSYRSGNASTEEVVNAQLTQTVGAITWVRDRVVAKLTGVPATRATAAFNEVIDIMTNGIPAADAINFGPVVINANTENAADVLQLNKAFFQAEITAWIANEYPTLIYDVAKCERDVGYLIDSATWDVKNGSNAGSVNNARLYFDNAVSILPEDQKVITSKAFDHLSEVAYLVVQDIPVTPSVGNVVAQDISLVDSGIAVADDVRDLISIVSFTVRNDDFNSIPNYVEPVAESPLYADAAKAIDGIKASSQAGVITFIAQTYNGLSYNKALCRRDVGLIVDAVSKDIEYGYDNSTVDAARYYFDNAVNILPEDQRIPTRLAFEHLGETVRNIVQEIVVTPTTGNVVVQDTTGIPADITVANTAHDLIQVIADLVDNRTQETLPTASPILADPNRKVARENLQANKTFLQAEVINYINDKYSPGRYFTYDEAKCSRDVGFIIDAVSHDIQYGGNAATLNAAGIYFSNAINILPEDQREPTRLAFEHLASVVNKIVQRQVVVPSEGNVEVQDLSNIGGNPDIGTEVEELVLIISNIADDVNDNNLPIRIDPDVSWVDANYVTSKELIEAAVEDLTVQVIDYISATYNGLSFPVDKCRRDIGIIIDALSYDVNYTTNYATRIVAQIYFENGISVLPFNTRAQTADVYNYLGATLANIVQEVDTQNPAFTATVQNFDGTPATATEGTEIDNLVQIIEDAIRNDSLDNIPALQEPILTWVGAEFVTAAETIDTNSDPLADDMIEWLNTEFNVLDYNKAKCRRDVGYLLDAFSFDLNYGGNAASRWNADFYFWNNVYRIPEDQREATAKSYRYLGKICSDIVIGEYTGQRRSNELGTLKESRKVQDLANIFYTTQINKDVTKLPLLEQPDFTWQENQFLFSRDILTKNRIPLAEEVIRFVNAEYNFVDINLTRRDAGNLIQSISDDFRDSNAAFGTFGSQTSVRTFTSSLFDFDGTHVFPVFNPTTPGLKYRGSVGAIGDLPGTGNKPGYSYIVATSLGTNLYEGEVYRWNGSAWISDGPNNTVLLEAFYKSWEKMRDFIKTTYSPGGGHDVMLDGLFNDVLISNTLRPEVLTFGSLVESIAHQFNGASAGVNRRALPLNFRNLGSAISASASVLSEDGGRIRWSGADELNNQYFARGLRINGRTGRIEGRPFTSSVRKLARRASNSRASI